MKHIIKSPAILAFALFVLLATNVRAEVSRDFHTEAKALLEANIADLMANKVEDGPGYHSFRPSLKLSGFEVTFMVSNLGNILSAKYLAKASADDMDIIYEELNIMKCLVFDSNHKPGLIGKSEKGIITRKIMAKRRDDAKDVMEAALDKSGVIHLMFFRQ